MDPKGPPKTGKKVGEAGQGEEWNRGRGGQNKAVMGVGQNGTAKGQRKADWTHKRVGFAAKVATESSPSYMQTQSQVHVHKDLCQ